MVFLHVLEAILHLLTAALAVFVLAIPFPTVPASTASAIAPIAFIQPPMPLSVASVALMTTPTVSLHAHTPLNAPIARSEHALDRLAEAVAEAAVAEAVALEAALVAVASAVAEVTLADVVNHRLQAFKHGFI